VKVALICSKYPPDVGGGETHIRDLAAGLAARRHDVRILTGTVAPESPPDDSGWTITSLPSLADFGARGEKFKDLMPPLFAWLHDTDPEVVHVFNHLPALAVGLVRRAVAAPVVISLFETLERGVRVFDMWRVFDLERAVQGAVLAAVDYDLWICDSEAYLSWAREGGADEAKLWRGAFCVDPAHFAPPSATEQAGARMVNGLRGEQTVIGFPSRLVPRKGFEDVLHGLAYLRTAGGARPTVLVPQPTATSDERYHASIVALIDSLGLESQCAFTRRSYTVGTMPQFYAACDYVIQPARAEGLGIALLEAMSMRIPVLCSRVEGHTEVVRDGETGFLFEPGDPQDAAGAIARALSAPTRPVVERAAELVERQFSPRAMLDAHEGAYQHVSRSAERTRRAHSTPQVLQSI